MPTLEERLTLLEARHRRLRQVTAGLAGALGLCAGALAVHTLGAPLTLRAQAVEVTDAEGHTRGVLRTGAGGGAELVLSDAEGKPRLRVGLGGDGSPQVRLAGTEGQALADLSVYGAEGVRLALSTPHGTDFFSLGSLADGSARLALADALGRPRAVLLGGSAAPGLELVDGLGAPRARLTLVEKDTPRLVLEGKDGVLFQAPF